MISRQPNLYSCTQDARKLYFAGKKRTHFAKIGNMGTFWFLAETGWAKAEIFIFTRTVITPLS